MLSFTHMGENKAKTSYGANNDASNRTKCLATARRCQETATRAKADYFRPYLRSRNLTNQSPRYSAPESPPVG